MPGSTSRFDDLLAEAAAVPVHGWDFSWFDGRASEERPSWHYAEQLAARLDAASAALDVQTGGGEVLAWSLGRAGRPPRRLAATESFAPNAILARAALAPFGATVARVADAGPLPYRRGTFELVSSRHPVVTPWAEIARVLRRGGTVLSQQIGAGTNHALSEHFLGRFAPSEARNPRRVAALAEAAGLEVTDLREATLEVSFSDVAAVVVFLRKVVWTVPAFSVEHYRDRLRAMHDLIERDGAFICHSRRFLIEARKPG